MTFTPWAFITVAIAGWMNRQQQQVIEYLKEENRILREKAGQKRIMLDESQKRGSSITRPARPSVPPMSSCPWKWKEGAVPVDEEHFELSFRDEKGERDP